MGRKRPWNPTYTKILVAVEKGEKVEDIAKTVDLKPRSVYRIMARDIFQEKRQERDTRIVEKARCRFEEKAEKAVGKIIEIMEKGDASQRLQFDAAKEIIYQCGLKPVEVIETRKREYSKEELESALGVVREVESITERLSGGSSKFLLKQEDTATPSTPIDIEEAPIMPSAS